MLVSCLVLGFLVSSLLLSLKELIIELSLVSMIEIAEGLLDLTGNLRKYGVVDEEAGDSERGLLIAAEADVVPYLATL